MTTPILLQCIFPIPFWPIFMWNHMHLIHISQNLYPVVLWIATNVRDQHLGHEYKAILVAGKFTHESFLPLFGMNSLLPNCTMRIYFMTIFTLHIHLALPFEDEIDTMKWFHAEYIMQGKSKHSNQTSHSAFKSQWDPFDSSSAYSCNELFSRLFKVSAIEMGSTMVLCFMSSEVEVQH